MTDPHTAQVAELKTDELGPAYFPMRMATDLFREEKLWDPDVLEKWSTDMLAVAAHELCDLRTAITLRANDLSAQLEARMPAGGNTLLTDSHQVMRTMKTFREVDPLAVRRLAAEGIIPTEAADEVITTKTEERVDLRAFNKLAKAFGDVVSDLARERYSAPRYDIAKIESSTGEIISQRKL